MNIIYLTWGETPRSYGVFGSQVLRQFNETRKLAPSSDNYYFVSALPIVNSGLIREKFRYFLELKKIKDILFNINFCLVPIFLPQNFINSTKITFKFFHFLSHFFLKNKIIHFKPNIIHCRSYHAAYAAIQVREKYNFNYKIIFDARSLWPEALALGKNQTQDSPNYNYLKKIEHLLLLKSDSIVAVSAPMVESFNKIVSRSYELIYLSAECNNFSKVINNHKKNDNKINVCYLGAVEENSWHKLSVLVDLFDHLNKISGNFHFKIITNSSHKPIRQKLLSKNIKNHTIISTKTVHELTTELCDQDIGVMSYFIPVEKFELELSKTVLAVKTAEYLSAGIPMLCNLYCDGAAQIIEKHKLGVVYNPKNISSIDLESLSLILTTKISSECRDFAKLNFDYYVNAKKYYSLYKKLI